MKKTITFFRLIFFGLIMLFRSGWAIGQTTINFDNSANWIKDGTISLATYANHAYSESGLTIQGTNVVRNGTSTQDGFDGALGTYSMRLRNVADSKATITVSTGGVSTFSIKVRRWDGSPLPDYTVKYSVNAGTDWTSLTNINGALLTTSDWFTYSGTINSAVANILIDIQNTGTTERIMIDDFTWTGFSSDPTITVSPTTLTGYSYTEGSGPSTEKTFTVSGANLTSDITLTPPTNYEISTTAGSGFTTSIILAQIGGAVAETTIYTRLKVGLSVGDYNAEDITASSTGATDKTIACSGSVISATPVLALTSPNGGESWVAGTTHAITWSSVSYSTTVDIEYTNDGTNFTTIADNETNNGTYSWSIPSALTAGTTYKIRISDDKTSITTSDLSDADFVIKVSSPIIINEVDSDTEGDDVLEFIELYDGGSGNTALDGLVLVLYNGSNDLSYKSFDLDGYSTDGNGYFVIGNSAVTNVSISFTDNFLQNGADAAAFFYGNAADFPTGTAVTTNNLIDAFVYDTNDSDDAGLLVLLNDSEPQINENGRGNSALHSNQRFPNGSGGARNTTTYGQYPPTPGAANSNWLTTWTGTTSTDWATLGNWTDGIPTEKHDAVLPDGIINKPIISTSTMANCYNLTLEGDATLNIISDASNSGSLIFGSTYTGSATAVTYQRYMTGAATIIWHLMGSPFTGQTIASFLSNNLISGMVHFNESSDSWSTDYTTTAPDTPFALGQGYATRRSADGVIALTGTPNNTTKSVTLTRNGFGWNLLSNPFTSAISANSTADATNNLISVNAGVLDDNFEAIYIWDKTVGASGDYVIINHASGTPSSSLAQNYLQVGQGFFVKSVAGGGSFAMTPAMQSHHTDILFKSDAVSWANIVLNVETTEAKSSTRIAYREDMHRGLDIGYDAGVFKSGTLNLYSRLLEDNGVDFGIQCLPTDFENLIVPIGLDAKAGEIITFSANALNIPEEYTVVLEDRALNIFTDLSDDGTYSIQLPDDSQGTGRFYIQTSFKSTTGIGDLDKENSFLIFAKPTDNQLIIRGDIAGNTIARIYSITGKQIAVVSLQEALENRIQFNSEAGVYILQIANKNETFTQKFAWVK